MGYRDFVSMRIVRSDGAVFELSENRAVRGWFLPRGCLEGFADLDLTVSTSDNVLTDGSSVVSKRVNECDRTIDGAVYIGDDPDKARGEAIAFFNPKHTFELHLSYRGRTRWCEGELTGFSAPQTHVGNCPTITFTLLCPNPYMMDESGNESAFGDATPMFGFPFVSHCKAPTTDGKRLPVGFNASRLIYDGKNTVYNSGDVPTMYRVRIEAEGELVNPTITKDGKHVKLLTTLKAGDVALIDFESAPTRVTINGNNALQLTSRDSSFTGMRMQVGANTFAFSIDNEENRSLAKVQVLFHKKYLGV